MFVTILTNYSSRQYSGGFAKISCNHKKKKGNAVKYNKIEAVLYDNFNLYIYQKSIF